ncbi:MAG: HAMP domain-containing histidine kinase [Ruminococcus sp.]|nr:HAMP domain-containing histidine kinase [Ruminococcus sp.]MDE7225694.1 HAMP domain-containing histidine kinase [Ruminococcus sp.]
MNYKESSYYKIFRLIVIIIFCVLVILGAVIISVSSAIYQRSQLNSLKASGELFRSYISDAYHETPDTYIETAERLCLKLAEEWQIRIFMYDENGKCLVCADGEAESTPALSNQVMEQLGNADYLDLNTSVVSQSVPALTFGSKFFVKSKKQYVPHYIMAYRTTDDVESYTFVMLLIYIAFAFLAMAVCYVFFRYKTGRYIEYESQLLKITGQYAKGDFSEKLVPAELSQNLQLISDHVNAIAARIEKSEETSSTFIANVSHELRTPMTTIGGFVDGILDGTIKKSRQQEYLVLVSQEIQRLRILITSMLNMSRFEAGTMKPNFQETNITDLVIKVVLMFEKNIEAKELQIEELDSSRLMAVVDADLMQQVVYNLVENAVKFVNKGGTLSFRFDKKDDICIIGIRNTGEGLKDSEIQQVFDRFYKTDSSRGKDKTGLGLGLSISRKIVHLHKGHIVVKSVYGEYTEFQIQIPVDPTKSESIKKI